MTVVVSNVTIDHMYGRTLRVAASVTLAVAALIPTACSPTESAERPTAPPWKVASTVETSQHPSTSSGPVSTRSDAVVSVGMDSVDVVCGSLLDLHSDLINIANTMSAKEIRADPAERARLANNAIDAMVNRLDNADLSADLPPLTTGLRQRRTSAVEYGRQEATTYRATWLRIEDDDRRKAIAHVFLLGETLMSETKLRLPSDAPSTLVEAVEAEPSCRFIVK